MPRWRLATLWFSDSGASVCHSLIRILSTAHHQHISPALLVANFAQEHRMGWKWRLSRLAKRLQTGMPVADALERTPDVLSDQQTLAIRFSSHLGIPGEGYAALLAEPSRAEQPATQKMRTTFVNGGVLVLALGMIGSFLSIFIFPMLEKVSDEFGLPSTAVSKFPLQVIDYVGTILESSVIIGVLLFVLWLVTPLRRFIRRLFGALWAKVQPRSRSAELLTLLAQAEASGRPITGSLAILARYHYDPLIRRQLLYVRNEVELGRDAWDCFREARLISDSECIVIQAADSAALRVWTLRQLALVKNRILTQRYDVLASLSLPLVILAAALVVATLVLAVFLNLVDIIYAVEEWR